MAKHPNKHVRQAIAYAESNGWTFKKAAGHAHVFGELYCPERSRDGHIVRIHSTPANPENHAKVIRRIVDQCQHEGQP